MHAIAHQKLRTVQDYGDCHLSVSRIQVNAICSAPSRPPPLYCMVTTRWSPFSLLRNLIMSLYCHLWWFALEIYCCISLDKLHVSKYSKAELAFHANSSVEVIMFKRCCGLCTGRTVDNRVPRLQAAMLSVIGAPSISCAVRTSRTLAYPIQMLGSFHMAQVLILQPCHDCSRQKMRKPPVLDKQ